MRARRPKGIDRRSRGGSFGRCENRSGVQRADSAPSFCRREDGVGGRVVYLSRRNLDVGIGVVVLVEYQNTLFENALCVDSLALAEVLLVRQTQARG